MSLCTYLCMVSNNVDKLDELIYHILDIVVESYSWITPECSLLKNLKVSLGFLCVATEQGVLLVELAIAINRNMPKMGVNNSIIKRSYAWSICIIRSKLINFNAPPFNIVKLNMSLYNSIVLMKQRYKNSLLYFTVLPHAISEVSLEYFF